MNGWKQARSSTQNIRYVLVKTNGRTRQNRKVCFVVFFFRERSHTLILLHDLENVI